MKTSLGYRSKVIVFRLQQIAKRFVVRVSLPTYELRTKDYGLRTNAGFAPTPILSLLTLCRYIGKRVKAFLRWENFLSIGYQHAQLRENRCRGFALLLTLVIVSIILSIGLTILQITTKQISLSNVARESEVSFHAASTGLECLQYYRSLPRYRAAFLREPFGNETQQDVDDAGKPYIECADSGPVYSPDSTTLLDDGNDVVGYNYVYQYNLSYDPLDTTDDTCVEVSMYLVDLRDGEDDVTEDLENEGLSEFTCEADTICTTIFSRGYNRPCDQLDSLFTVQRELTIQY